MNALIQLSGACQLRYPFCPRNLFKDKLSKILPNKVNINFIKLAIQKCLDFGIRDFDFSVVGDPLLEHNLESKLEYIDSINDINTAIFSTNLLGLNSDIIKILGSLRSRKIILSVSVYGFNRIQYLNFTGSNYFEIFIKKFEELFKSYIPNSKINPPGYILGINIRCGQLDLTTKLGKMIFILKKYGATIEINQDNYNWGGLIPIGTMQNEVDIPKKNSICRYTSSIGIHPTGEVILCGGTDIFKTMILGNIFDSSLKKILSEQSIFGKIIKDQNNRIFTSICEKCNHWKAFKIGTFKNMFTEVDWINEELENENFNS